MKKWIVFSILLYLVSCKGENTDDIYLTPDKATDYFRKIEAICNKDNGKLWGKNLYGPLMFVERETRKIVSNYPDKQGTLKAKDGIYTGTYPKELIINNIAINYGGTLFALSPLPHEEDEYRIITRGIHSLFHRFQETEGYTSSGYNTTNMDERPARIWLKLEWKALRKAIESEGNEQKVAIRDALIFRGASHELYPQFIPDNTRFENYEGLATFTYTLLCTDSPETLKTRLLENLDRIYSYMSYSRSYGSVHGALYASLLHQKGFDFSTIKSEDINLADLVRQLFDIELPLVCRDVAGSLALNYDIREIRQEETDRESAIEEGIKRQLSTFIDKPVVFIELESPYFDFEPEDVHPMGSQGTLYNKLRISDNWGKLTVEKGGCLVANNLAYLRVTAKGYKADKNRIEGEDWSLMLNNNWEMVVMDENYLVRRLIP
jgi:hypothetical protein